MQSILDKYFKENKSLRLISKEVGFSVGKVRKIILDSGKKLRDKGQAQKAALESGRADHPTAGKPRSEKVKRKVSQKMTEYWANADDEAHERMSEKAKKQWQKMSIAERQAFQQAGYEAVRYSSKHGSKLERFLETQLTNAGYAVKLHQENILGTETLQLDIYIPQRGVVIEIDGPSHFLPIWGEDALKRQQKADNKKNSILLTRGLTVVRVKVLKKYLSNNDFWFVCDELIKLLKSEDLSGYMEIEVE